MGQILVYLIAVLTVAGSLVHTLMTDPATATLLTPTVKGILAVVAVVIGVFLEALPKLLAKRPPPVALLMLAIRAIFVLAIAGMIAMIVSACSWFSSNRGALVPVEVAGCVFGAEAAGLTPQQSADLCGVAVEVVNDLLKKKHDGEARARASLHDAGADR